MFKKLWKLPQRVLKRYLPGVALTISRLRNLFSVMGRRTKRDIIALQLLMFVSSIIGVLSLVSVVPFLSMAAIPEKVADNRWMLMIRDFFGIETNNEMLAIGGIFSLSMLILSHLVNIFLQIETMRIRNNISLDALQKIADYYLSADHEFHLASNSGMLFNKMFAKASTLISQGITSVLTFNRSMLMLTVAMTALFILNPLLMLLNIFLMAGVLVFSILRNRVKVSELQRTVQITQQKSTVLSMETLRALENIRVMGREMHLSQKLTEIRKTSMKSQQGIQKIGLWFNPFIEITVYGVVVGIIIFYAAFLPTANVLPELILFGLISYRLMPIFKDLHTVYISLQNTMVVHDFVGQDLLLAYRHTMTPRAKQRMDYKNILEMKDVNYRYPETSEDAITGVNLSIPQGSWIGFCGRSGSGKTTLMKILLGFLPFKGEILVDGRPLNHEAIPKWQNLLGYVSQDINLVDASILSNVTLGLPDELVDRQQAQKVLKLAELSDFVDSLPEGMDTEVGDRGLRLSGGQRQRLVIARALYSNPDVLIFDEATSALDNVAEYEIIKTLRGYVGKQTLLMSAHRLSTIKDCDMLVFMEDGCIRATGSYEELMEHNADFRHLVDKENKKTIHDEKSKKEIEKKYVADSVTD